jgi:membrane fusion protein (multidrug efflux system)
MLAIALGASWIAWPAQAVSTDDAYVKADSTVVAPKIQGLIARVLVRENQSVRAGQPLIEIDPEDYRQAVSAAEADVASAQAGLAEQDAQERLAAANAQAANAGIRSAEAQARRAFADDRRFTILGAAGDVSRSLADQMRATAIVAAADVQKSQSGVFCEPTATAGGDTHARSPERNAREGESRTVACATESHARDYSSTSFGPRR